MPGPDETPTRVGIGLIGRDGHYLIRQRRPGQIMAGVWEFPGGKCEPGESARGGHGAGMPGGGRPPGRRRPAPGPVRPPLSPRAGRAVLL